jgi:hypothetical protein
VFASRARSKSREIDSISPAGSIRFHAHGGSRPLHTSAGGLPHSIDAFRSRESPTSIIFCRFLPWLGRPSMERRSSRPAPACDEPRPLSLLWACNRPLRIRRPRLRFGARGACRRASAACCGARTDDCGVSWKYSKICNRNSALQRNFNHKRVLFVQHPLEKGPTEVARSGSLVACAEVLGNCDQATEGGIPRSSRFRWFA